MKKQFTNHRNILCFFTFLIFISGNVLAQDPNLITIKLNKQKCSLSIEPTEVFNINADLIQIKIITGIPDVNNITDFRLNDKTIEKGKPDTFVGAVMYSIKKAFYANEKGKEFVFKIKFKNGCTDTLRTTIKVENSERAIEGTGFILAAPPTAPLIKTTNDCMSCDENDPGIIYYDFKCKKLYRYKQDKKETIDIGGNNYKRFKKDDKIQLKVVNVNRYLYDINVKGENVSYNSEMPALLGQLLIGDTTLLGTLLSRFSTSATASSIQDNAPLLKNINTATGIFYQAVRQFQNEYNKMQEKKLSAFELCTQFYCCDKKERESYTVIASRLLEVRLALSNLQTELKSGEAIKNQRKELQTWLAELKGIVTDCDTTGRNFDASIKKLTTERDDLKAKFDAEKDEAKKAKLKDDLAAKQKELDKSTGDKNTKSGSCKERKDILNLQIKAKQDDLLFYSDLDQLQKELPSERDLMALTLFLNNMTDLSNSYTTPPIFPKGNRLNLTLKIKKSEKSFVSDMNILPYDSDSIPLDIFIVRRPFVSFSSGSFMALGTNLQNKTYGWQALPDNTNTVTGNNGYILTEKAYTPPPMGFSAFLSAQWKETPMVGWGFSGGVGLTIESSPRLAYLAGTSLFLGDRQQFTLTAGIAGMQVEKLTSDWQAVAKQQIRYSNKDTDPEYYKEFKTGMFISLSYTIFK